MKLGVHGRLCRGRHFVLGGGQKKNNSRTPVHYFADAMAEEKAIKKNTRVAVIGAAGRNEDGARMTKELFETMTICTRRVMNEVWKLSTVTTHLVSGGAAWSDHVAVCLFLNGMMSEDAFANLTLYLPCAWCNKPLGGDRRANEGRTMNALHNTFAKKLAHNTLEDIESARQMGANLVTLDGFHARNTKIAADAEYMIAFTWSENGEPKKGGTYDTWSKCKSAYKLHVPLSLLRDKPMDHVIAFLRG